LQLLEHDLSKLPKINFAICWKILSAGCLSSPPANQRFTKIIHLRRVKINGKFRCDLNLHASEETFCESSMERNYGFAESEIHLFQGYKYFLLSLQKRITLKTWQKYFSST